MRYLLMLLFISACQSSNTDPDCRCEGVYLPETSQCVIQFNIVSMCTEEFKPVCGCNGVTYGNACLAHQDGVKKTIDGVCQYK